MVCQCNVHVIPKSLGGKDNSRIWVISTRVKRISSQKCQIYSPIKIDIHLYALVGEIGALQFRTDLIENYV